MARSLLAGQDLEAAVGGGEVVVARGTIIRPRARDEAESRGIAIPFE